MRLQTAFEVRVGGLYERKEVFSLIFYSVQYLFMSDVVYLIVDDFIEINKVIIERFGGEHGMENKGTIEFTVSQMEVPKNIFRKAAILMRNIITGHAFTDGNKRTGFEAMKLFLERNGKIFILEDEEEIINMVIRIAKGEIKVDGIQEWIQKNSK